MKRLMHSVRWMVILGMGLGYVLNSSAQEQSGGNDLIKDSVTDLSIVVAAGVTGAIIGISTLPFVEEPKEHLNNILIGGSIGIILGVGFVAYSQAMKGRSTFQTVDGPYEKFDTRERYSWHQVNHQQAAKYLSPGDRDISALNYLFTF
ncbi:MAG: hypothetical protein A2328_01250 [Bdellovibrionales bacterium RIFOXYB2_FULL_36_6]|nr:MAG: hypothetical protein A2328_01250 [Bdellovibrionales bacterium RIFOXYB2_FULL_36_6]